ncbi:hypothetical protein B296_00042442, partial [Ensete ventricosum]
MEDIEDLVGAGAPPGLRLPVAAVGIKPKRKPKARLVRDPVDTGPQVPGTQVLHRPLLAADRYANRPLPGGTTKIDRQRSISVVDGRLKEKSTVDDRLKEKSIVGGRLRKKKGRGRRRRGKEERRRGEEEERRGKVPRPRGLAARGSLAGDFSPRTGREIEATCTVKSPSQSAMTTLISKCRTAKKPLVVAGCVPQGSRDLKELEGISIIGVQQIDRVVEVVEETLKGHEVRLLSRKTLPSLDLPKVFLAGEEEQVERVRTVISEGVKEIWLSSEDTGAYGKFMRFLKLTKIAGRDIGTNLPLLLNAIIAELPSDRSTMLRIGMTNPPYILEHLKDIAKVLCHPCVYSFLHVPVQSGSDSVLTVIYVSIATSIQAANFGGHSGTPAARMKKVPSTVVKNRSRELTTVFESFSPYQGMEGQIVRIWITEIATDGIHLVSHSCYPVWIIIKNMHNLLFASEALVKVGHTKGYIQVLVVAPESMLGTSVDAKITSVGRWSAFGEVIDTPAMVNKGTHPENPRVGSSLHSGSCDSCECSRDPEPCQCLLSESCVQQTCIDIVMDGNHKGRNFIGSIQALLVRKRSCGPEKKSEGNTFKSSNDHETEGTRRKLVAVDYMLLSGMALSFLTSVVL